MYLIAVSKDRKKPEENVRAWVNENRPHIPLNLDPEFFHTLIRSLLESKSNVSQNILLCFFR